MNATARFQPVIAVTGLAFEARIAAGAGVSVVCGGHRRALEGLLHDATNRGSSGIISFGTAGALARDGVPGSWVIATGIVTARERFPTNLLWSQNLKRALPHAIEADIAGVDAPVADPKAKHALHERTGAAAVDMESHVAASIAATRGLPFAACRVIIDPVHRALPPAALIRLRPGGAPDIAAVLASVLRRPGQLPSLLRTAADAYAARAALRRGRGLLGAGLALPDFGLLERDVPREHELGGALPVE